MQSREKYLLMAFVAVIGLWAARPMVQENILGPLDERQSRIRALRKQLDERETRELMLLRDSARLRKLADSSLPPDPLTAQRLYQEWLTDQAVAAGWNQLQVTPERRIDHAVAGTAVQVQLEGQATLGQFARFLYDLHRTRLLQQLVRLEVEAPASEGSGPLNITLVAEGMALSTASLRGWMFPEARVTADLAAEDTVIRLEPLHEAFTGLATQTGSRLQLGGELAGLKSADQDSWTIERGLDGTQPRPVTAGDIVRILPTDATGPLAGGPEVYRELIRRNPFRPWSPPRPELAGPTSLEVQPGVALEATVATTGFETEGQPVQLGLRDAGHPGMRIDTGSGKFTWTPPSDLASGSYTATVVAEQPATAADGSDILLSATKTLTVQVRRPNSPPEFVTAVQNAPLQVGVGQPLDLTLSARDAETPVSELRYQVQDPPAGLSIDATSGRLTWAPAEDVAPGEYAIRLQVTDGGDPPASASRTLQVIVLDDAARYTYLVASVVVGGRAEAWLFDRAENRRIVLHQGSRLHYAGVRASVQEILPNGIVLTDGAAHFRLPLGENLSSMTREPAPPQSPTSRPPVVAPRPATEGVAPSTVPPVDGDTPENTPRP